MNLKRMTSLFVAAMFLISCSDFKNSSKKVTVSDGSQKTGGEGSTGSTLPADLQKPNEGPFSEAKMLVNIGANVQAAAVSELQNQSQALKTSVRRYCEALKQDSNTDRILISLEDQFQATLSAFHFVNAANSGPLTQAGQYLLDNIYSWPYVDYCGVDRSVVALAKTGSPDVRVIHTSKGLAAIEYLLFERSQGSRCNMRANPQVKEWLEKSVSERAKDRCDLAVVWSDELLKMTTQLEQSWSAQGGNYTAKMVDGSLYASLNESTNALVDSLFVGIEKVKDARLGKPTGRHKECTNDSKKCPELVEHIYSGNSITAVKSHLLGFKAVWSGDYAGVNGYGLEDFVRAQGHAAVADKMNAYLASAISQADVVARGGSLEKQIQDMDAQSCLNTNIENRLVPVCALHADVREVANLLKIEIFTVLSLRLPSFGQGDND